MRKGFLIVVAVVLAVAMAAPAMADTSLNGFVRTNGWMSNFVANGAGYIAPGKDLSSNSYVEERARFLLKTGNENVKAVYYAEFDQAFGDSAYTTGRNMGGGLEADTTNIETKNLYVWFKVPNTSADFTVGVQNQSDSYAGVLFGYTDLAGVFANFKVEPVAVRLGWSKFWENTINRADDIDLYVAEAKFSPTKDVKLGLNLYFLNDMGGGTKGPTSANGGVATLNGRGAAGAYNPAEFSGVTSLRKVRVYIPGVDFSANAGPAKLTGFAFYESGKAEGTANSVNIKGYVADLRADANLGPGKGFLEAIFVSGDNNRGDKDYKGIISASNYQLAASFYCRTNMMVLLPNPDDINSSYGLTYDVANGGAGIFHVAGGYSMKLGDKLTGAANLGYLAAAKKRTRDSTSSPYNFSNETAMGTEVNANVNYNITKGLDIGVYAGYAWLGSAYDTNAAGTAAQSNDNLWTSKLRLNYAF